MEEKKKKALPYASTVIAHCGCGKTALIVCATCKHAWCADHISNDYERDKCKHGRKQHDELRKLSEGGLVTADNVIFIS